jgi:hypothetical protein
MEHRSPRCVFHAEQVAKFQSGPLESDAIVIEVRLGETASVAPMAQKRTIVHPSVACPRGCRAVGDESCSHCSNLFLNEELDKDGVGMARLPYQKIMMFSEP